MVSLLVITLITAMISLFGSLQLGPVNLYVINLALFKSRKEALWVALGGSLPEFIYCSVAVFSSGFVQQSNYFLQVLKIVFILNLIVIGFTFLLKKTAEVNVVSSVKPDSGKLNPVLKGFSLAALNPQLLPFWMFVLVYFNSVNFLRIENIAQKISFVIGSGLGAFALLLLLIIIVSKYKTKIVDYVSNKLFFKLMALLFFGIAIQQIILVINSYNKQ